MRAPTIQLSLALPAALAGASVCLSLVLLRGGGEALRPLPVAPVVNTAAGPVEAVLGPPSRLLTSPRILELETPRVAAKTPAAHDLPQRSQQQKPAQPAPAPRVAPKPPTAAPAPAAAPAPVEASAVSFAVKHKHNHGRGKALGRNDRETPPGQSDGATVGRAEGHESREPKTKKHSPGKPETKATKTSPGKPPKPQKASSEKAPNAAPAVGQDPGPSHGSEDDGHDGGGHGGGKK